VPIPAQINREPAAIAYLAARLQSKAEPARCRSFRQKVGEFILRFRKGDEATGDGLASQGRRMLIA
jgi:hypothetical protein